MQLAAIIGSGIGGIHELRCTSIVTAWTINTISYFNNRFVNYCALRFNFCTNYFRDESFLLFESDWLYGGAHVVVRALF